LRSPCRFRHPILSATGPDLCPWKSPKRPRMNPLSGVVVGPVAVGRQIVKRYRDAHHAESNWIFDPILGLWALPTGLNRRTQNLLSARCCTWDATMVEVTSENRFDMLTSKACDVVCEATTVNMERREDKEFSLISFITGAVFLYPKGLGDETQPEGEVKVGLLSGTTIDEDVKDGWLESGDGIDFTFERQESHEQGAVKLAEGGLHAYVADREIIEQFLEDHPSLRDSHEVTRESLSYEPYALAVRLGDDKLRIEIDRVLAEMFRSGEINELLQTHIPSRRYDPVLNRLFEIQSLPK